MYEVVVGSKLHGLDTKDSDTDTKGIYVASLKDVLDPWTKLDRARSEGPDKTFYELSHFARLLASCNPTVLEVAYSPLIVQRDAAVEAILVHAPQALDAKRIKDACIGYAQSQLTKVEKLKGRRQNKAMVAAYRMYLMALQLLDDRNFDPVLKGGTKDWLLNIKENGMSVARFRSDAAIYKHLIDQHPAAWRGDLTNIKQAIYKAYTKEL